MSDTYANRPAPTASGTLAKTPFVHLLLYALDRKLQGTIELAANERRATVLFIAGMPAKVRTSEPIAYLGRVLLELGYLDQAQLDRTLAELSRQKGSGARLHGDLLMAEGIIDVAKLHAGLKEQTARKLRHVAGFPPETTYAYYDAFDALRGWGGDGARAVDPVPLLWGMVREHPPQEHVDAALARVGSSALRLAQGADVARLALGRDEASTLDLLRARPMRASELASAVRLGERAVRLLVYLLLVTKLVDVVAASPAPPPARAPSPMPPAPRGPTPPPPAPGAPTTSVRPPKAAAQPAAEPPSALSPQLAERWREITARAATIDRADYFTMLGLARDASRDEVEGEFMELAKRWHPDRLPAELAPVRDACSRVFARMSEARATLTDDEQRARYMRLLADGSGSPEMQETVAKVVEAATNFQKAEVCFKRNDLAQAEAFCRKAIELDASQADYHALLAWLVALKPESQSPEKTAECVALMNKAIALNNRCEKAYYWRGMLHKRLGKSDLALKDFRRVAEMNPRHIDAAREVRLAEMRGTLPSIPPGGRSSSPPKAPAPAGQGDANKPGLLGRLFKKS